MTGAVKKIFFAAGKLVHVDERIFMEERLCQFSKAPV